MDPLLTIGAFAERCGLSRSALRFYDQNGLLTPELVDDDTGYRYYAFAQIEQATLVRRLRAAEVPVGVLRRYLAAADAERDAILDEHLASFRRRAAAVEAEVKGLRDALGAHPVAGVEVPDPRACVVTAAALSDALRQVRFAVADPAVRAELGAVWTEAKEDSLRLVATDSYRLAVRDLVPAHAGPATLRGVMEADRVDRLLRDTTAGASIALRQDERGEITATVDGRAVAVGHAGASFPDYERILSGLASGHRVAVGHKAMRRALSELPATAPHLSLAFEPGRLRLRARDRSATVRGRWSGPRMTVYLDLRFFCEAVDATVGPDLVVEASDPLEPITLRSADTGTFSVLTMPIRPPRVDM